MLSKAGMPATPLGPLPTSKGRAKFAFLSRAPAGARAIALCEQVPMWLHVQPMALFKISEMRVFGKHPSISPPTHRSGDLFPYDNWRVELEIKRASIVCDEGAVILHSPLKALS